MSPAIIISVSSSMPGLMVLSCCHVSMMAPSDMAAASRDASSSWKHSNLGSRMPRAAASALTRSRSAALWGLPWQNQTSLRRAMSSQIDPGSGSSVSMITMGRHRARRLLRSGASSEKRPSMEEMGPKMMTWPPNGTGPSMTMPVAPSSSPAPRQW
ncbi:MAG: hypothetical protein J3K34DRAFT_403510 [Monoraphidium minutum]|nr:MAG: hypothetical protein J3K34DRAFT_403510 [Monoraphidium minutum]